MTFARVLAAAGLTKVELARLYGVSRQSIHAWKTTPPRVGYTARMAESITAALLAAIAKGMLPFGAMSKEARAVRIERMRITLQSLKPAPTE